MADLLRQKFPPENRFLLENSHDAPVAGPVLLLSSIASLVSLTSIMVITITAITRRTITTRARGGGHPELDELREVH